MRTTLDLPEDLLEEARRVLGFKSKTDTVVLSLVELVRRRRIDELKALAGKVHLDLDVDASRQRTAAAPSAAAPSAAARTAVAPSKPVRKRRVPRS